MKIYSAEHRPSKKASSNWFSGTVWQDPIIETPAPGAGARAQGCV
jgi:hypothetical protein